jgi:hypothetical protein
LKIPFLFYNGTNFSLFITETTLAYFLIRADQKRSDGMGGIIFGFFAVSAILFFGTIHYIIASYRPGMYPPKNILKKRALVLAGGGAIMMLVGWLLLFINQ